MMSEITVGFLLSVVFSIGVFLGFGVCYLLKDEFGGRDKKR
jgi:hypothetical protein